MRITGHFVEIRGSAEAYKAFVPLPLPPDPPLKLTAQDQLLLSEADRLVGRLDGMSWALPDMHLFIDYYVKREAVVSSQIEGTQSSFSDLLLAELVGQPSRDTSEVSNYVKALRYGQMRIESLPLSLRLLRELHAILLAETRGAERSPGEFRRTQNWVGGTRPGNALFVPPPVPQMMECLAALERFMYADEPTVPPLIKAALLHLQFETIHPFLDGNGRIGRLLIVLCLMARGALKQPILYVSLFLKQNRNEYYSLLQRVRTEGVWEEWVRFFLTAVRETAVSGIDTAQRLKEVETRDFQKASGISKSAGILHRTLLRHPTATIQGLVRQSGLSTPTVTRLLLEFETLGMVEETTGRQWGRIFSYRPYLSILEEGMEPLPK